MALVKSAGAKLRLRATVKDNARDAKADPPKTIIDRTTESDPLVFDPGTTGFVSVREGLKISSNWQSIEVSVEIQMPVTKVTLERAANGAKTIKKKLDEVLTAFLPEVDATLEEMGEKYGKR